MFNLDSRIIELSNKVMGLVKTQFASAEAVRDLNQQRMLWSFTQNRVSTACLSGTTGYGYNDVGRDTLDRVFATVVGSEAALFRESFVSGTHAISVALFGILRPGDKLLYATGTPYDTLHKVIGKEGDGMGSLCDFGVLYSELPLVNGRVDIDALQKICCSDNIKVVALQRSCGYDSRPVLTIRQIKEITAAVKSVNKKTVVFVDNCYGEFVEENEPTAVGADIMAGSLIKNAGGGIASRGGYIAGRADLIEKAAFRLTVPGIGAEIGSGGNLRELYLGLYFSPGVVCEAVKTAIYAGAVFTEIGYKCSPDISEKRSDILLSIETQSEEKLIKLCKAIQSMSPIDSFVQPIPAPMPGYDDDVIMACGAFTAGSSIELSCDGPIRAPHTAYLQGGLNFEASRMAILNAIYELEVRS